MFIFIKLYNNINLSIFIIIAYKPTCRTTLSLCLRLWMRRSKGSVTWPEIEVSELWGHLPRILPHCPTCTCALLMEMDEESRGGVNIVWVDNVLLAKQAGLSHKLGNSAVAYAHLPVMLVGTASVDIPQVRVICLGVGQDGTFHPESHPLTWNVLLEKDGKRSSTRLPTGSGEDNTLH